MSAISKLPTFDPESGELLTVVDTPKGSRNKYAYNDKLGIFELRRVLPRGMLFPYDFGFVPSRSPPPAIRWTCCCFGRFRADGLRRPRSRGRRHRGAATRAQRRLD